MLNRAKARENADEVEDKGGAAASQAVHRTPTAPISNTFWIAGASVVRAVPFLFSLPSDVSEFHVRVKDSEKAKR